VGPVKGAAPRGRLLRTHVRRGAQGETRLGQPLTARGIEGACYPKIGKEGIG